MSIVQCYKTTDPIQGVLTLITEQSFLDKRIRVFGTPEDPLFLARDVAEWIDYNVSSVNKMLANVDEDEKNHSENYSERFKL